MAFVPNFMKMHPEFIKGDTHRHGNDGAISMPFLREGRRLKC
jgi:hypothetical protein